MQEVDVGLAADLGTLQRLPKVVGNQSWVRDICLTGRWIDAAEALNFGLVSAVYESRDELRGTGKLIAAAALKLGKLIASKPPIATMGTK